MVVACNIHAFLCGEGTPSSRGR